MKYLSACPLKALKNLNAPVKKKGINFAPLALENFQAGSAHGNQQEILTEELRVRGAESGSK